jgi:hypothetical protein
MIDELRAALDPVADAFEALGVDYRVGGSVASSALGVARTTLDIDLVADLRAVHVAPLVPARRGHDRVRDRAAGTCFRAASPIRSSSTS